MKNFSYVNLCLIVLIVWFTSTAIADECFSDTSSQETEKLVTIVNESDLEEIVVYHLLISMKSEARMRHFLINLLPTEQAKIFKFNMRRLILTNDFNYMQVEFVTRMLDEIDTMIFQNVVDPQISAKIDAILLEAQSLFSEQEVSAIFSTQGVIDTVKKVPHVRCAE